MSEPSIRLEGLPELVAKLRRLSDLRRVIAAVKSAAGHVKRQFQEYPPRASLTRMSVYGQTFQSERQRRYFFAALRDGRIEVPYRRGGSPGSRNIKQSWTVTTSNGGMTAEIGTNAPYAGWLHRHGQQSRYHAAVGWRTDQEIMDAERETVVGYITDAVREELAE